MSDTFQCDACGALFPNTDDYVSTEAEGPQGTIILVCCRACSDEIGTLVLDVQAGTFTSYASMMFACHEETDRQRR